LRSAATDAERKLWSQLRDRRFDGCKFRRQHPIGPFIADFACIVAKLVIFSDRDVLLDTEAVLSAIHRWLVAHPHPSPLPHAGEGVHAETTTS
jgi:adenine-specific DNA-methyltransferase